MTNEQVIHLLRDLVELDRDAVRAYEQAIANIDIPAVKGRLEDFKGDHERHVKELSSAIRKVGGDPPEPATGIKGFLLEGFTAIRSATGAEGAMKAMKTNEKLTNRAYDRALSSDLPPDVRAVVERHQADDRKHLAYIERCLEVGLDQASSITPPAA